MANPKFLPGRPDPKGIAPAPRGPISGDVPSGWSWRDILIGIVGSVIDVALLLGAAFLYDNGFHPIAVGAFIVLALLLLVVLVGWRKAKRRPRP